MSRFIAAAFFAAALLILAGCRKSGESSPSPAAPPDAGILLITLDTTRADHLSCYARLTPSSRFKGARTPNLDALSARGTLFTNATVQAPLTLPSHASLMTGDYPTLHGMRGMEGFSLDKSHATLASIAQSNGFATAAFVGSRVLARNFGLANGFSTYDDEMGNPAEDNNSTGVFAERRAEAVTDRAIGWLKENGQKSFFLWAHYFDPHAPYDPPEPFRQSYAEDSYSGEIAYMDQQVGRLLDTLTQMGLQSRTLVAVIGDHGESLGEHGEMTHGVFLYDSTLRVPFLLAGPGVPRGKVIQTQVRSIDVMPTILAFLHLHATREVQGVSLWPAIQQPSAFRAQDSYAETLYPRIYMGWSELRAIRTERWKLIVAPRPELYDVERDPGENNNLFSIHSADAGRLQKKLWEIAGTQRRQEKIVPLPAGQKTLRELKALGYLSGGTSGQIQLGTNAPDPKDRVEVLKILTQVEDLLADKDYPHAARQMEQAWRLDPTNPRCHIYLATAYEQMGQYRQAIQVLQHALEVRVATDKIYSRLGVDYLHLGQLDKAIDAMEHANRLNPGNLNNLLNLGMAYLQAGKVDGAGKAFNAIAAQNDRFPGVHNGLGLVAVQRGDAEGARREFEKALEVNPDEVKSLLDLGILYQQTGNRERALHYLQLFISRVPRGQFTDQLAAVRAAIDELKAR